jgi:hypothetical protein
MGDRNRTYLSQEWTGVDGKQIVRKNGSCGVQWWAGSLAASLGVCGGVLPSPGSLSSCHVPVWGI